MSIIYCKVVYKPNLYTSSNERVTIEIIALLDQKPLKPSRRLRKKPYVQLVKKASKLNQKTRKKTGELDQ